MEIIGWLLVDDRDKKMKPAERFGAEVVERLHFLSQLPEFEGPNVGDGRISFHSSGISVHFIYDSFAKSAITVVTLTAGDLSVRAEISCLYSFAGLGPVQDIKRSARNSREVAIAITTQAEALRRVLPLLMGPTGEGLMRGCHARY